MTILEYALLFYALLAMAGFPICLIISLVLRGRKNYWRKKSGEVGYELNIVRVNLEEAVIQRDKWKANSEENFALYKAAMDERDSAELQAQLVVETNQHLTERINKLHKRLDGAR